MDARPNAYIAIFSVNFGAWGLIWIAQQFVPELGRKSGMGLYFILMPFGFGLFGWDLSYWAISPYLFLGLGLLLTDFRQKTQQPKPRCEFEREVR